MKDLLIIGAGGHGRVIADIAQKLGRYGSIAFLDDGEAQESMRLAIVGKIADMEKYVATHDIFVAIGDSNTRKEIMEGLFTMGASIPTLIHPSAVLGACVELGVGTAVMAGAVIGPCSKLGMGVILNTCSSVDHDCSIGDYSHIAVGVHVAGTVRVGSLVFLGAGVTVKNNVNICSDCVIGAGAVVIETICDKGTYVGVPARLLRME